MWKFQYCFSRQAVSLFTTGKKYFRHATGKNFPVDFTGKKRFFPVKTRLPTGKFFSRWLTGKKVTEPPGKKILTGKKWVFSKNS